jgi:hypothetical protein
MVMSRAVSGKRAAGVHLGIDLGYVHLMPDRLPIQALLRDT